MFDIPSVVNEEDNIRIRSHGLLQQSGNNFKELLPLIFPTLGLLPLLFVNFNICRKTYQVPQDWKQSITILIYKGRGDKEECTNWRPICLKNVYGGVLCHLTVHVIYNVPFLVLLL